MSAYATQWALAGSHHTTPIETLVLLALAHHYSEDKRRCWPSHLLLVRETRLARSTVSEALASLERAGLITRAVRQGTSTRYTLPIYEQLHRQADVLHRQADIKDNKKDNQEKTSKAAPGKAPVQQENVMKVSDIQAKVETQYASKADEQILNQRNKHGDLTSAAMVGMWRDLHGKYVAGFLPVTRSSEQSMLVQAKTRIGEEALPRTLLAVLKDWHGFTAWTKDKGGAFNTPAVPQIGFFLRYCELALAWANHSTEEQSGKAKLAVHIIASEAAHPPSPHDDKPTLTVADIQDALGEL